MLLRLMTITFAVFSTACTVLQAPPAAPQRVVVSTVAQQKVYGPIQLAKVTVDWQDVSTLKQPQTEAKRLSQIIYSELDQQALINDVAADELQVKILEVFLRSGSPAGVSTDYIAGEIELLDGTGVSKRLFRIKANYTQRGGGSAGTDTRLDKLYTKFADLTIRELTINQETQTSVGVATTL